MNKKLAYNIKRKRYKMVEKLFSFFTYIFEIFIIEFIVQFKGYYNEVTRSNYLNKVLQRNNVSFSEIIKRNNLMQHYPSDFDIVRVRFFFFSNL